MVDKTEVLLINDTITNWAEFSNKANTFAIIF